MQQLVDQLWQQWLPLCPDAPRVRQLLESRGEKVVNDHIALRSFGLPGLGIDAVARPFLSGGYRAAGQYEFTDKPLRATHYDPPRAGLPKVFISELIMDALPLPLFELVAGRVSGPVARASGPLCQAGRPWSLASEEYEALADQSEYAGWLAAFGYVVNHFTVDVGRLKSVDSVEQLCDLVEAAGIQLNTSGGRVKGTEPEGLRQASTRAGLVSVALGEETKRIPGCYYEFAQRFHGFGGFVVGSAAHLFESTDRT